jgi:ERCC4-type nuclease
MIYIDDRIGSGELLPLFTKSKAEIKRLEYGDFMFWGNYSSGPVPIAAERKTLGDFITSMETGRLVGHQLIGLVRHYRFIYLVIEGVWRYNTDQVLEVRKGGGWETYGYGKRVYTAAELEGFKNALRVSGGVMVVETSGEKDTVARIEAIYRWWSKAWDSHKSLKQFHLPEMEKGTGFNFVKPPLVVRMACALDGVGEKRALALGERFKTAVELVNATAGELGEVDGIGEKGAGKIFTAFRTGARSRF